MKMTFQTGAVTQTLRWARITDWEDPELKHLELKHPEMIRHHKETLQQARTQTTIDIQLLLGPILQQRSLAATKYPCQPEKATSVSISCRSKNYRTNTGHQDIS